MGIPALWDTIRRHEEIVPIAKLAEDHHRHYGKPLRIAVDEADWRFNNLTPQQVHIIRESSNQQAFQGIEKAMFYRICRLLTLNIHLIFVFDGPRRPWKRGKRGQGRINFEERRLLQELLKYLGVPYHEAPGEAEAECARMQILGIVDAVWSQDSDCLMFGCTLWLHDYRIAKNAAVKDRSKENTKKTGKYASVVRATRLEERHKLDREGLVLFAMLVGGDYNERGLPQCGATLALQAVRHGLGKSLCACQNDHECRVWGQNLALFLQTTYRGQAITVPPTFPDYQTLKKYFSPTVTSDQELLARSRLNLDYVRPIQEHELLRLTSERFNMWGRLYMNWVGPVLLTRDLVSRESFQPKNMVHDIRLIRQRSKKTDDQPPAQVLERKLTFSPFGVSCLCRADFEGPQFGNWNGDDKVLFDQEYRVECEIPEYWLRKALPEDVFDPFLPSSKPSSKRKRTRDDEEKSTEIPDNKRKQTPRNKVITREDKSPSSSSRKPQLPVPGLETPSKLRNSDSPIVGSERELPDVIEISDSDGEELSRLSSGASSKKPLTLATNPCQGFGSASSSRAFSSIAQDRYEDLTPFDITEEEDDDDEDIRLALRLSLQESLEYTKPPLSKGKFDDIFEMREAGRSVQGLPVPAWSVDHTASSDFCPTTTRASRPEASSDLSMRNGSSSRGTHANIIATSSTRSPARHLFSQQASTTRDLALLPTHSEDIATDSRSSTSAPAPTEGCLDEIRSARLRHFAAFSAPPVSDTKSKLSSSFAGKSAGPVAAPEVPEDIECIDLTED